MLAATLLNHALASEAGAWLASMIGPLFMRWILGMTFVGIAIWSLMPAKPAGAKAPPPKFGVFGTTLFAFFLLEMGDKTQFATIALAAHYESLRAVVAGSTIGIMLADVPVVMFGAVLAEKLPREALHRVAPALFLTLGVVILLGDGWTW
jgi:putative Ca2+/H+ antiporter (TMEM165/GDT1 family)